MTDDNGVPVFMSDVKGDLSGIEYGNISRVSVDAIQRRLLVLQQQGGKQFLGEPALGIHAFHAYDIRRSRVHQLKISIIQ